MAPKKKTNTAEKEIVKFHLIANQISKPLTFLSYYFLHRINERYPTPSKNIVGGSGTIFQPVSSVIADSRYQFGLIDWNKGLFKWSGRWIGRIYEIRRQRQKYFETLILIAKQPSETWISTFDASIK